MGIGKDDILVHSIGCGCDEFWQVVKTTPKTVTARRIEYGIVKQSVKHQSMEIAPVKDKFVPPSIEHKYIGGYRDGKSKFKKADGNTIKLRIAEDGHIGPIVRMEWWRKWDGKSLNQYSP